MTAEEREHSGASGQQPRQTPQPAPCPPMSVLLAACAAAEAVSTPPAPVGTVSPAVPPKEYQAPDRDAA